MAPFFTLVQFLQTLTNCLPSDCSVIPRKNVPFGGITPFTLILGDKPQNNRWDRPLPKNKKLSRRREAS